MWLPRVSTKPSTHQFDIPTSWSIPIVLSTFQVVRIVVLHLLLKREIIEFTSKSELPIDFLLANVEIPDVEETDMLSSICQLLCQLFLAAWLVELT